MGIIMFVRMQTNMKRSPQKRCLAKPKPAIVPNSSAESVVVVATIRLLT